MEVLKGTLGKGREGARAQVSMCNLSRVMNDTPAVLGQSSFDIRMLISAMASQRILESNKSFDWSPSGLNSLVCSAELHIQHASKSNSQCRGDHRSIDTGPVVRRVLGSEHCRADDTTNTAGPN